MIRYFLTAALSWLTISCVPAQQWDWAKTFPISSGNFTGLALSHDGYLYASGTLQDTLWLGGDTLVSPGQSWWLYGSFLAKFDTAGTLIWSRFLGTDYGFLQIVEGPDQLLYLSGGLRADTVSIGSTMHFRARGEMLLAQMTPDGDLNWTRNFADANPSGTNRVSIGRFTLDSLGNLYICGTFNQTGYFGADTLYAAEGTIYVSKLDNTGAFLWTAQAGCNQPSQFLRASASHVDPDGNIYVVGRTSGTMQFGPLTFNTPQYRQNGYLARYDQQGNCIWVTQIGPATQGVPAQITPTTQPVDVITDHAGNPVITGFHEQGSYFDTIYLAPEPGVQRGSFFLAKYSPDGHALWVRRAAPGSYSYSGASLLLQESGRILVSGGFRQTMQLGTVQLSTTYPSGGATFDDKFIAEYSASGSVHWAINCNAYLPALHLALDACGYGRVFVATAYDYYAAIFGGLDLPAPDTRQLLLTQLSFPTACPITTAVTSPSAGQLTLFPNPGAGTFNVRLDAGDGSLTRLVVRDAYGRVVHAQSLTGDAAAISLPARLANGLYTVEVVGEAGSVRRRQRYLLAR